MNNDLTGFLVSALAHLGLISFILVGATILQTSAVRERPTALKLSMFQPPPSPVIFQPVSAIPPNRMVAKTVPKLQLKPAHRTKSNSQPKPKPIARSKPIVWPKPQPTQQEEAVARPQPEVQPLVVSEPAPIVQNIQKSAPILPDPAVIERAESEYKARLQAAIEARKKYPRRARRFRQQGSVSVAFKVQKNGRINDMRVASSSNSMILDKAALQTVQRVSTLFPLPEELNRAEWAFIIPINYNLH